MPLKLEEEQAVIKIGLSNGGPSANIKLKEALINPNLKESLMKQANLEDFLRDIGVEILNTNNQLITLRAPNHKRTPSLGKNYGFQGGTARLALQESLGYKVYWSELRDFDVVRMGKGSVDKDHEIALQYMPDDYRFGHGVRVEKSLKEYMANRDLTINQVLLIHDKVYASPQAIRDTLTGVIRATENVTGDYGHIKWLIAAKMLRMKAFAEAKGEPLVIEGFQDTQTISSFAIAVHLKRALEQGHVYGLGTSPAEIFISALEERNLISVESSGKQSVADTMTILSKNLKDGLAFFRGIPLEIQDEIIPFLRTNFSKSRELVNFVSCDPSEEIENLMNQLQEELESQNRSRSR